MKATRRWLNSAEQTRTEQNRTEKDREEKIGTMRKAEKSRPDQKELSRTVQEKTSIVERS